MKKRKIGMRTNIIVTGLELSTVAISPYAGSMPHHSI
jgi:hypothetical protein